MFTIIHVNVLDVNDAVVVDNKSTVKLSVSKKRFHFFWTDGFTKAVFPIQPKVIFPVTLPSQQSLTVVMKVSLNLPLRFGGRLDIVEDFKECRATNL
jgi:hypothetical protein